MIAGMKTSWRIGVMNLLVVLLGGWGGQMLAAENSVEKNRNWGKEHYEEMAEVRWLALKKIFSERDRERDVFGAMMDPGTLEEIVVPVVTTEAPKVMEVKKVVLLQEAVDKFQVNGVNAKKQMVMVGFRSLRRGDPVEIQHEGVLFKLRIVKITTDEVVFLNTKNQEKATVRLGVFRGFGKSGIRGVDPLKKNVIKKDSTLQIK